MPIRRTDSSRPSTSTSTVSPSVMDTTRATSPIVEVAVEVCVGAAAGPDETGVSDGLEPSWPDAQAPSSATATSPTTTARLTSAFYRLGVTADRPWWHETTIHQV